MKRLAFLVPLWLTVLACDAESAPPVPDAGEARDGGVGPTDGEGEGGDDPYDAGTSLPEVDAATKLDAGFPEVDAGPRYAHRAHESFETFDRDVWRCEYTCPSIENEMALFALEPNVPPDQEGSWSKARYKPQRFTAGRFTVRFSLNRRPAQKVWWGVALWDDGPEPDHAAFNEINFGYTTDQSYEDTELRFESARRGVSVSERVNLGVDLYDGNLHEATLEYDAAHVAFYFDGELAEIITHPDVIPEDPMDFILGPRLVTEGAPLSEPFEQRIDWVLLEW